MSTRAVFQPVLETTLQHALTYLEGLEQGPVSASATLESICIFVMSPAIWKIVGVLKLEATVWPSSTARKITTPSTATYTSVLYTIVNDINKIT